MAYEPEWLMAKLRVALLSKATESGWTLPRGAELEIIDTILVTLEQEKVALVPAGEIAQGKAIKLRP